MAESREASVYALLADGTTVRIRGAGADDTDAVRSFFERMSPANRRLRFFSAGSTSAQQAADRVGRSHPPGYRALVAEHEGALIGLAEYETVRDPRSAEISLAVGDDWHHRGVGTLLLEHLAHEARTAGFTAFFADALADNHEVLKVFADLGLRVVRHTEGPEARLTVELRPREAYLSAVDARGSSADVASLLPLLRPRSVVVIGAGRTPGSVGRAILRNIRTGCFTGRVLAVHPKAPALLGIRACPTVADLPVVPDLAVIAVPASAVVEIAQECGQFGVRALCVVTAGLDSATGSTLMDICRRHGMRMVGPNCLGLANTETAVCLDATFAARHPGPGSAGVAVQSGGVGIALLDGLHRLGIGVSSFVSLGDKYDVSGNDLLQWWESDDRTDLALLHLESFGNPRAFSRTARRVSRTMPVLTVDAGRSEAGHRAAASHTAAAATRTTTRAALFAQAGVTATRSISELLDAAALMHSQPLPVGARVAIVSNAGGAAVLAADACEEAGLTVPPLGPDLVGELLARLPAGASAANPVDTTPTVDEEQLRACIDRLAQHGAVDAVLVLLVPTAVATATGDDLVQALAHGEKQPRPVVGVLPAQSTRVELLDGAVPVYGDAQDAARALAHAVARARWLNRQPESTEQPAPDEPQESRALVTEFLAANPEGGWLDPGRTAALLDQYDIPQIRWAWARDESEAVAAAERLVGAGGQVVMKAHWPGLLHKSQEHALHLDLRGSQQVRAAHRDLTTRFGELMTGVVIQPLADRGTELFAGIVQDGVFGPLVVFGQGGTATDLLADHAARLAPLDEADVLDLITAPRCEPLLFGYAGAPKADLDALEDLLRGLSRMACDLPQLAEADLNPVLAGPHGIHALDARIRLVPREPRDPYLRRLR
ncbi:GNAT family N-acetyltransferase [Streptomyces sp. SID14478]|uniref:bifunctional acetate--CoA ligase family protein/GNAT family N-acetyltransferase n=1 Tax=Streptomyces sp. SID14478 TaxID=2706073 RepID=UPI0013DA3F6F|nr:bifunctional GNAT family N-acetyltransferase/acetate--CoA ligase family protein [Streptomyces sp. SID14478]NEB74254.1 GNAT family N-acetyltransferase [Streptomyces sp. SID14478]